VIKDDIKPLQCLGDALVTIRFGPTLADYGPPGIGWSAPPNRLVTYDVTIESL
jgi:hypothetical protein